MELQFTPYILVTLFTTFATALLAYVVWSRRPGTGVHAFVVLMLAISFWSLMSSFELAVVDPSTSVLFSSLTYIGITLVPPAWLVFVLQYTGRQQYTTPRYIALLAIQPVLVILAVMTNPLHQLFYADFIPGTDGSYVYVEYDHGIFFWSHAVYSYVLIVASVVLLVRSFARSHGVYRRQMSLLLGGQMFPWISNLLFLTGQSPFPAYVDSTPLAFALTGIAAGWSLLRYRLIELTPVARNIVFDNIDDVVFVVNTRRHIIDANVAASNMLGQSVDEIIGTPVTDVFHEHADLFTQSQDAERTDTEINMSVNDTPQTFRLKMSPIRSESGDLTARVMILQNITSLKQANRQLSMARDEALAARHLAEENLRLKSEFLSTMSHELRTPLHAIEGYTSLMLGGMGIELDERPHRMVERISTNSKRLLELINNLLDLSRMEAGRLQLDIEPIVLADLVTDWQSLIGGLTEKDNVEFVVHVDPDLPEVVHSDVSALTRIGVNLLGNAFKFTHEGSVTLRLQRETDSTWAVVVADTGIGIPEKAQQYIFDEFRQVDGSLKREYGGTGLGLALVYRMTEALGGDIHLESEPDVGSTFTVLLPIELETDTTTDASPQQSDNRTDIAPQQNA
jgi:PAS domain S-box-containing protein